MKKVVCVVDNHIYLKYGKIYEVVSEKGGKYKLLRDCQGMSTAQLYWWGKFYFLKTFFVSLDEFRNKQIEKILECTTSFA